MSPISCLDEVALVVSPKKAASILDVGLTRVYELINEGAIESYRDGKSRKLIVASLKAYIARQIEAEATKQRKGWTDRATEMRMAKRAAGKFGPPTPRRQKRRILLPLVK